MSTLRARWRMRRQRWGLRLRRTVLRGVEGRLAGAVQLGLRHELAMHRERLVRGEALPPLEEVEFRVFSQGGEDGILLYLLALVGWERRRFLEIGIQDGWECNCANLAKHLGWCGWFVEGDPRLAALARQQFAWDPGTRGRPVHVISAYLTRENAPELLTRHGVTDVEVLSIDIDGMDWWLWQSLEGLRPRVVVVEYNAAFGPDRAVTVPYRAAFDRWAVHPTGLYYGASLAAFERLGRERGYRLVGCNATGVNAFFVRDDVAPEALRRLTPVEAFRENTLQSQAMPLAEQFAAIAHLPLETV